MAATWRPWTATLWEVTVAELARVQRIGDLGGLPYGNAVHVKWETRKRGLTMDRVRVNCLCHAALSVVLLTVGVRADDVPQVNRQLLDTSLALGKKFLLSNQLPDGSFRYEYHLATGELATRQSQVRQAGTLWGVALIHQDQPTQATRDCVLRGWRTSNNTPTRTAKDGDG